MAVDTAPLTIEAARAVLRARGESQRVVVRLDDALAGPIEGVALCDEVAARVRGIALAVANEASPQLIVNKLNELGYRAQSYRQEFRRIAAGIEGPDAA